MEYKPPCSEKPCQSKSRGGSSNVNVCLRDRPVLYAGVVWIGAMRRFLIPRSCGIPPPHTVHAVVSKPVRREVVNIVPVPVPVPVQVSSPAEICQQPSPTLHIIKPMPNDKSDEVQHHSCSEDVQHRSSSEDVQHHISNEDVQHHISSEDVQHHSSSEDVQLNISIEEVKHHSGGKEGGLSVTDKSSAATLISQMKDAYETFTEDAKRFSEEVKAMKKQIFEGTSEAFKNMRGAEAAATYRYIAVSSSGLGSYLLGLRSNIRTRVVYTATGVIAMATLCYPEEVRHYNLEAVAFLRGWAERGIDLVVIDFLHLPNEETPDGRKFSFLNYERRIHNFFNNKENGHETDSKSDWEDSNDNYKLETNKKNIEIRPDDKVAYSAEERSNPTGQCEADSTHVEKPLPIPPVSASLNHKNCDSDSNDPILRNEKHISLEDNENNGLKPEVSTNHLSDLQDDQQFPGVAETGYFNIDLTKQNMLKDGHEVLSRKVQSQPSESSAGSVEKQSKYTIDSSTEDCNLYTRRT